MLPFITTTIYFIIFLFLFFMKQYPCIWPYPKTNTLPNKYMLKSQHQSERLCKKTKQKNKIK